MWIHIVSNEPPQWITILNTASQKCFQGQFAFYFPCSKLFKKSNLKTGFHLLLPSGYTRLHSHEHSDASDATFYIKWECPVIILLILQNLFWWSRENWGLEICFKSKNKKKKKSQLPVLKMNSVSSLGICVEQLTGLYKMQQTHQPVLNLVSRQKIQIIAEGIHKIIHCRLSEQLI